MVPDRGGIHRPSQLSALKRAHQVVAEPFEGLDEDIRRGAKDRVTTTVEDVTARSFREFLS
ncbi:hypothetical protein GCM10022267_62600 [Lentzea roselyniae]|uniref:Uncharacterized protein n=1 Tax=Lentzea roselyniae TaxID=531940 RepID=A0ABP7BTX3_9PSEU